MHSIRYFYPSWVLQACKVGLIFTIVYISGSLIWMYGSIWKHETRYHMQTKFVDSATCHEHLDYGYQYWLKVGEAREQRVDVENLVPRVLWKVVLVWAVDNVVLFPIYVFFASVVTRSQVKAFQVGQLVKFRDKGQDWKVGRITSLKPLEAAPTGWAEGFQWHEITRMNPSEELKPIFPGANQGGGRTTSSWKPKRPAKVKLNMENIMRRNSSTKSPSHLASPSIFEEQETVTSWNSQMSFAKLAQIDDETEEPESEEEEADLAGLHAKEIRKSVYEQGGWMSEKEKDKRRRHLVRKFQSRSMTHKHHSKMIDEALQGLMCIQYGIDPHNVRKRPSLLKSPTQCIREKRDRQSFRMSVINLTMKDPGLCRKKDAKFFKISEPVHVYETRRDDSQELLVLDKGTVVQVMETHSKCVKITVPINGWIHMSRKRRMKALQRIPSEDLNQPELPRVNRAQSDIRMFRPMLLYE